MTSNIAEVGDQLKQAMRGLASSVAIISAIDRSGIRNAMTATSATSLSLDPPSMLLCINRSASLHAILAQKVDFAVNLLGLDHLAEAQLCAGKAKGAKRFETGDWRIDESGLPYLGNAQSVIICTPVKCVSHGTHDIIIGNVRAVHVSPGMEPLVYAEGVYKRLASL